MTAKIPRWIFAVRELWEEAKRENENSIARKKEGAKDA